MGAVASRMGAGGRAAVLRRLARAGAAAAHRLSPAEDLGQSFLSIELPPGATIDETDRTTQRVAALLRARPEVAHVFASIGAGDAFSGGEVRQATLTINLKPTGERTHSKADFELLARPLLAGIPDIRWHFSNGGGDRDVSVVLTGADPASLTHAAQTLADADEPGSRHRQRHGRHPLGGPRNPDPPPPGARRVAGRDDPGHRRDGPRCHHRQHRRQPARTSISTIARCRSASSLRPANARTSPPSALCTCRAPRRRAAGLGRRYRLRRRRGAGATFRPQPHGRGRSRPRSRR